MRLNLYCYPPEAVQRGRPSRQRMLQRQQSLTDESKKGGGGHSQGGGGGGGSGGPLTLDEIAGPRPTATDDGRVAPEPQVHGGDAFFFSTLAPGENAAMPVGGSAGDDELGDIDGLSEEMADDFEYDDDESMADESQHDSGRMPSLPGFEAAQAAGRLTSV